MQDILHAPIVVTVAAAAVSKAVAVAVVATVDVGVGVGSTRLQCLRGVCIFDFEVGGFFWEVGSCWKHARPNRFQPLWTLRAQDACFY